MKKSRNPTFVSCGGMICGPAKEKRRGLAGFCVPEVDTVTVCAEALGEGCICAIGDGGCKLLPDTTIIDIYISNKSDETLHLIKGEDKISILDENGGSVKDAEVGWMSAGINDYKPPSMIENASSGAKPAFMRGYVLCFGKCCKEETTFSIALRYSIGVPGKKLGTLIIPVCRTKPKGTCDGVSCKHRFGDIELCVNSTISINPPSGIYSVIPKLKETQAFVEISGGTNGDQTCTVSPDNCPTGMQCNPKTLKCEKKPTGGGIKNRQLIIIIAVSAVAVILVFGFLIFLFAIRSKEKKSSK